MRGIDDHICFLALLFSPLAFLHVNVSLSPRGKKGMQVYLCVWHVKRTWLKNLKQKVAGKHNDAARLLMLKEISAILEELDMTKAKALMDAFLTIWVRFSDFPVAQGSRRMS